MRCLVLAGMLALVSPAVIETVAHAAPSESCLLSFDRQMGENYQKAVAKRGYLASKTTDRIEGKYFLETSCRCSGFVTDPGASKCVAELTLSKVQEGELVSLYDDMSFGLGNGGFDCVGSILRMIATMPKCPEE